MCRSENHRGRDERATASVHVLAVRVIECQQAHERVLVLGVLLTVRNGASRSWHESEQDQSYNDQQQSPHPDGLLSGLTRIRIARLPAGGHSNFGTRPSAGPRWSVAQSKAGTMYQARKARIARTMMTIA